MSGDTCVALTGNPNVGKTSLFNALTGLRHRTGNFPGVTVEWKSGAWQVGDHSVELLDLPGTYSLVPDSPDEAVVVRGRLLASLPQDVSEAGGLYALEATDVMALATNPR